MYTTYYDLEFIKVTPRNDEVLATAKYPDWTSEFNFLIQPDGRVMGKSAADIWLELGEEFSYFVRQKVNFILTNEPDRICS